MEEGKSQMRYSPRYRSSKMAKTPIPLSQRATAPIKAPKSRNQMSLMDETTHISATITREKDDDSSAVSPRLDKWADDKSTNTANMFGNPLTPPHIERETPTLGRDKI